MGVAAAILFLAGRDILVTARQRCLIAKKGFLAVEAAGEVPTWDRRSWRGIDDVGGGKTPLARLQRRAQPLRPVVPPTPPHLLAGQPIYPVR